MTQFFNYESPQTALSVDCLSVQRNGQPVLRGVSLHISQGEIFGLLGPNGAGKSTTIAAIAGLLPYSKGQIQVFGQDLSKGGDELRRRIGFLTEDSGFYGWMTAMDYLAFFAGLYGLDQDTKRLADLLEMVRLTPQTGQTIATYSRGMKQRLGLARALIAEPELLILDEPTNGLDPRGRRDIHDILIDLAKQGVAILFCSHILDDVDRLCQGFGIIVNGETVVSGARDDLLEASGPQANFEIRLSDARAFKPTAAQGITILGQQPNKVFVSLTSGEKPQKIWANLLAANWPIEEIVKYGSSLEDFYLAQVANAQGLEVAA